MPSKRFGGGEQRRSGVDADNVVAALLQIANDPALAATDLDGSLVRLGQ
jgi:hypothetical protein